MLERIYPGGTDAFMIKMRERVSRCRFVCADEKLVSASFVGVTPLRHVMDGLTALGLRTNADGVYEEAALWSAESPSRTFCKWLAWANHEDGYAMCWMADGEPGELHAPIGWQANRPFEQEDDDESLATTDGFVLSRKNGVEVTLNLRTGRIEERIFASANLDVVRTTLAHLGYSYAEYDARTLVSSIAYESSNFSVFFWSHDELGVVELMVSYAIPVPVESNAAVAEMMSRINGLVQLGHFELEYKSRNIRYRSTAHAVGHGLNEPTVSRMVTVALHLMKHYELPLMRIALAGASPEAEYAKLFDSSNAGRREGLS